MEDEAFCVQISPKIKKALYIPSPLYYYRTRPGQLIAETKFFDKFLQGRLLCSEIASNFPKNIKLLVITALVKAINAYYNNTKLFPNRSSIIKFIPEIYESYQNGLLSEKDWNKFLKIYNQSITLQLKSLKFFIKKKITKLKAI